MKCATAPLQHHAADADAASDADDDDDDNIKFDGPMRVVPALRWMCGVRRPATRAYIPRTFSNIIVDNAQ